jgi:hypothetical protein
MVFLFAILISPALLLSAVVKSLRRLSLMGESAPTVQPTNVSTMNDFSHSAWHVSRIDTMTVESKRAVDDARGLTRPTSDREE